MLRDLHLVEVYDSAKYDLLKDLMVPLLANSTLYMRGVGFFTSSWLALAAHGLKQLMENGGRARYVISPNLSQSDWEAFQLGYEAKCDEIIKRSLEKEINDMIQALETDTMNALAWMIADDILEFRFAIARENPEGSDYHDKVGVFIDACGDIVAIHGSFNESKKATLNGEAFSVFKSWEAAQRRYVEQHYTRLSELWEGSNHQFRVVTIPEAIKQRFVKLRTSETRPYNIPKIDVSTSKTQQIDVHNLHCHFSLFPYQEKAVQSWINAGGRGIFEMATGTGKTFTSLAAAVNRYENIWRLALIILVPYLHLIEQWARHCKKVGFMPILCSSAHENWHIEVKSKIQDYNIKAIDNICILAVHKTASSERFASATRGLKPGNTMIVGDEAHGLGSLMLKKAMIQNAGMRLGLSATPKRWFDDEGTAVIFSYFGQVCFDFPLEVAIASKYLTPYEYKPELVSLTAEEMNTYEELTGRIGKLLNITSEKIGDFSDGLKRLLLERSRIVASAEDKLNRLTTLLKELKQKARENDEELSHILVYCAPGTHKSVLNAVAALDLKCHEFVHEVTLNDRQKILDQFSHGDIQVLVAIKCLDEGVDVPSTRIAFFLASTSNPKEFVQRRGRVLRLAEGKNKAIIYDFIVVPRREMVLLKREIDAGLLKREMPRFAEFASAARNEFEARAKISPLLDHYELLNLFDKKPWDIYHDLVQNTADYDLID